MTETDLWREAFEQLHERVTSICDPEEGDCDPPENTAWADELRELANFGHELAHKTELNAAYAEITSRIRT
jgi:hypothetical protein